VSTVPTASFLVCGTPRGGTSLLCGLLAGTGLAGRPEEYFWRDDEPYWSERWGVSGFTDYLRAAIAQGTTPNGVFGAKVMFGYLPDLLGKLAALPGNQGLGDRVLLERAFFPNLRFVWIWREDVVAQAVSWSKAIQTGVWYQHDARRTAITPRFDFQQVHGLAQQAIADRDGWQRWFGAQRIEPFGVSYEALVADMAGTTRRVLAFLGIAPPEDVQIVARTARQTDALNQQWAAHYRELLAARQRR
jgi:LPS sulfotransferase NodH